MNMKLVIVDSNEQIRDELWSLLALDRCFELVGTIGNTVEMMDFLDAHDVDVIFINNQPAEAEKTSQGSYISAVLSTERPDIQVVIYGSSRADAYEACRAMSTGFLLYPFDILDTRQMVARLRYNFELLRLKRESEGSGIMVKTRMGYHLVRLSDILFIERINRRCRIVTEDGSEIELMGYTVAELESMLEPYSFFRCHQSFIVNLRKVSVIDADNESKRYVIRFKKTGGEISISREKYTEIVDILREKYAKLRP